MLLYMHSGDSIALIYVSAAPNIWGILGWGRLGFKPFFSLPDFGAQ